MTSDKRQGFPIVAKHLGCSTVAVIQFYNGKEDALTDVQKAKLQNLIKNFYLGNTPKGGFSMGADGSIKWSSKIEK
jgi:hypothetical protein